MLSSENFLYPFTTPYPSTSSCCIFLQLLNAFKNAKLELNGVMMD